jgi:hypothetical protein
VGISWVVIFHYNTHSVRARTLKKQKQNKTTTKEGFFSGSLHLETLGQEVKCLPEAQASRILSPPIVCPKHWACLYKAHALKLLSSQITSWIGMQFVSCCGSHWCSFHLEMIKYGRNLHLRHNEILLIPHVP